jgi:uncharacterized damage-inducible protein DinB
MRQTFALLGTIALAAAPLLAQAPPAAPAAGPAPSTAAAVQQNYNIVKNNVLKAADKMPDDAYDFKPTPDVRAFGGWVAHLADAQSNGCPRILGQQPAARPATPPAGKAAIVAYIKQSFDACDPAYAALTDANANDTVQTYRGPSTRLAALVGNVIHDTEGYGAMAVYLRLKGIVPPSSEPRK